jgi:ubiquinone/menaquinone biosynthesis C-methylase UbiE
MPDRASETERIRRIYDRSAGRSSSAPPSGNRAVRWLCSQAEGETLEIGIGRGRTLPFYSPHVRLSAIELSGASLAIAAKHARDLGLGVSFLEGDAAALPYPDAHFDTVVFCMVLCTIPDDRGAVAEAARVLRPGGRLLLLEHVRSPNTLLRGLERLFDPISVRRMGDHLVREPLEHVLAAGLEVEFLRRGWFGVEERLIARKPESSDRAAAG